jgi:hypothetical protein
LSPTQINPGNDEVSGDNLPSESFKRKKRTTFLVRGQQKFTGRNRNVIKKPILPIASRKRKE